MFRGRKVDEFKCSVLTLKHESMMAIIPPTACGLHVSVRIARSSFKYEIRMVQVGTVLNISQRVRASRATLGGGGALLCRRLTLFVNLLRRTLLMLVRKLDKQIVSRIFPCRNLLDSSTAV